MKLVVGSGLPTELDDILAPLRSTRKSILLIHFWSISCPACEYDMPYLKDIVSKYTDNKLWSVAVHHPRGENELSEEKVQSAASDFGITGTLLLDNDHKISEAFEVNAVPTYFLFDVQGKLRRQAKGNFGVRVISQAIQRLVDDVPEK